MNSSMSKSCCTNCNVLHSKCSILQEQVKILTDKLTELILHDKAYNNDISVQCNLPLPSESVSCCTDDLVNYQTDFTQTISEFLQASDTTTNFSIEDNKPKQAIGINLLELVPRSDINPCHIISGTPFDQFDINELDGSCDYQMHLDNRTLAYYGEVPYRYGHISHNIRPFSTNPYLCEILKCVESVVPDLDFNSVLITKFQNGNDFLRLHSDNEDEIQDKSYIATISLGMSRAIQFKPLSPDNRIDTTISPKHGSIYVMTSESQRFFQHSVPPDTSTLPRISITLRYINPSRSNMKLPMITPQNVIIQPHITKSHSPTSNCIAQNSPVVKSNETGVKQKTKTLYISSSMFSGLKGSKLSSQSQDATVLFYRGATAGGILSKLKNDPEFLSLDPKSIQNIYVLCGTNNVDKILNVPFSKCSSQVSSSYDVNFDQNCFNHTTQEFDQIYQFLHNWNSNALINFVNLLPRVSLARNQVINMLNNYLYNQCSKSNAANFINTENTRNLFCRNGYRNDVYFSMTGSDNVHLNHAGIIRISKHLKYLAHN